MDIIAKISSGIAGWLTFEDMKGNVRHHDESVLYPPITEIASRNGYEVEREFPLPRKTKQRGSSKEVDFLLLNERKKVAVLLEIKFKKYAKTMMGGISMDALKIRDITFSDINAGIGRKKLKMPDLTGAWKVRKAVMIVWREGEIVKLMNQKEQKPIRRQFMKLLSFMFEDPKTVSAKQFATAFIPGARVATVGKAMGQIRWASTVTHKKYWVAAFCKVDEWSNLS
ncbi:MAG: hypothetical protein ACTHLA_01440 [Asticcacaulis sp.]|uniref:hypothetical protein n=1 Tax=Asticcacaulis sp. TaxID=1872648 RepID=UPI003F7CC189